MFKPLLIVVLTGAGFLMPATSAQAVIFADGLTHIIDADNSFPTDGVTVEDGPEEAITAVNLVPGGDIGSLSLLPIYGTMWVRGSSEANVSGGIIGHFLRAYDSATIVVSGGTVRKDFTAMHNSAEILSGGTIQGAFSARDDAWVLMTGGTVERGFATFGTSTGSMSGGLVHGRIIAAGSSTNHLSGGVVGLFMWIEGTAVMHMSGGTVAEGVTANDDAALFLSGGTFGGDLVAFDSSTLTIVGSGFNFPLGDVAADSGTLTGTLADGSAIENFFTRASTATISLANPGCDDGIDNDGDGRIDFDPVTFASPGDENTLPAGQGDPGCASPSSLTEAPKCQDGIHNDGDGQMDYDAGLSANGVAHPAGPDPLCLDRPWWQHERSPQCGLGLELAILLPPLAGLYRHRRNVNA